MANKLYVVIWGGRKRILRADSTKDAIRKAVGDNTGSKFVVCREATKNDVRAVNDSGGVLPTGLFGGGSISFDSDGNMKLE